jgi:CheY-like chemotaxis protein
MNMKKIFLVEDNEDHALLIKRCVEDDRTSTAHFSDGLQVLKACEAANGENAKPDLILLDLQLPGMNGFDVLVKLRQMKWLDQVPVVMLTTSRRREEVEKAYQLGAAGFVVKSEDFGELMAKLKQVKDYWFHAVEPPSAQSAENVRRS